MPRATASGGSRSTTPGRPSGAPPPPGRRRRPGARTTKSAPTLRSRLPPGLDGHRRGQRGEREVAEGEGRTPDPEAGRGRGIRQGLELRAESRPGHEEPDDDHRQQRAHDHGLGDELPAEDAPPAGAHREVAHAARGQLGAELVVPEQGDEQREEERGSPGRPGGRAAAARRGAGTRRRRRPPGSRGCRRWRPRRPRGPARRARGSTGPPPDRPGRWRWRRAGAGRAPAHSGAFRSSSVRVTVSVSARGLNVGPGPTRGDRPKSSPGCGVPSYDGGTCALRFPSRSSPCC